MMLGYVEDPPRRLCPAGCGEAMELAVDRDDYTDDLRHVWVCWPCQCFEVDPDWLVDVATVRQEVRDVLAMDPGLAAKVLAECSVSAKRRIEMRLG